MWIVSGKITWAPLYLILFYFVFKKYSLKHAIWFSIFGFAAIAIGDSTATYLFKYNFARYRPSHHLFLEELLHFYEIKPGDLYKGGQYGFISGHATNSSIIATRSEEHTSELQSRPHLVCRLLLEKKNKNTHTHAHTAT